MMNCRKTETDNTPELQEYYNNTIQHHIIYQYEVKNEDDLANVFWELLQDNPLHLREVQRLGEIIQLFKSSVFTIVSESEYVDRQYRDSYYSYFGQKYDNYERNCVRLAFFEGKLDFECFADYSYDLKSKLIGTVVLRPLKVGNIGRTLLDPRKLNCKGYYRINKYDVMIYGRKLSIDAFPYSSQDGESMTCAETALFNLINYYGYKYSEYRALMPSEILQDIEKESIERVLPSQGVYESNMAKVLVDAHFYPRIYNYDDQFTSILYTYIESGIPLFLFLPRHVVSCIGHGQINQQLSNREIGALVEIVTVKRLIDHENLENKEYYFLSTAQLCQEYVVMDDNKAPYYHTTLDQIIIEYANQTRNKKSIEKIKDDSVSIIVPLYRRIFIDAARADSIFKSLFRENEFFLEEIRKAYDDMTWGIDRTNPFVWRMYLTASRSFKDFKTRTVNNEELKYLYMDCQLPRFIWVLEIGTVRDYADSKARVEIILDATSSPYSETRGILSIGYKGHYIFVPDDLFEDDKEDDMEENIGLKMDEFKMLYNYNSTLTRLFDVLYNSYCSYFDQPYNIFSNSNLERNF